MRTHNYSGEKGIAIFVTLMLLFLLSLITIAVLLTAYNYNNICEGQTRRLKAMVSAESGINYAYYQLRNDATTNFSTTYYSEPTAATITLNGITANVWATGPVSGRYTIKSKATYLKTQVQ
ncbi:MAG: hypothetical protein AUJ70_01225 [Candidatus Omnitrophica bacterium CG1_02_40_15]|nr:MAG: hypothetical protein AUJ70_01225 [Candidatus Omnitrophica bacterium CG1_02_40_15]